PLSHLAIALIGEGKVYYKGELRESASVLESLGITPLTLEAKEGLALINGTQPMTAQGLINYIEAEKLMDDSVWIASLTHKALNGIMDAFNVMLHISRSYLYQVDDDRQLP